jgi:hypothetical protein
MLVLLAGYIALGSDPGDPLYSVGGLLERALILLSFGWIVISAWWLRRVQDEQPGQTLTRRPA